jgi:tubulin-specific chaperone A
MPPPSQLAIATSVAQRLVKEEASYHKELEKQQVRLAKTQANLDGDENSEFQIKQEV